MPLDRAQIVASARRYLGVPIQHQGRRRAFDCVGLLLAVAEDLKIADVDGIPIRRTDYHSYGQQPVDGFIERECRRRLIESPSDAARAAAKQGDTQALRQMLEAGDVLALRVPLVACHAGIVSTLPPSNGPTLGVIHAYAGSDKVVEHLIDDAWLRRIAGVFSFPGVANG